MGQHCAPTLAGIPSGCIVSNYQWSVTGTTFQSWSGTTNYSSYTPGPGPLNGPNSQSNPTVSAPGWYWNDEGNTTETITCTATVTPPTGEGSAFSVTATQKVNVIVPTWSAYGLGSLMYVNGLCPQQGGHLTLWGNESWNATVTTPTQPAFGTGQLELVQLVKPNDNCYFETVPLTEDTDPQNGILGLDGGYPYETASEPSLQTDDNPSLPVAANIYSVTLDANFQDYLMYEPPGSKQFVPLAELYWSANGVAFQPSGGWYSYGSASAGTMGSTAPTNFFESNAFPQWSVDIGPWVF